MSEAVDLNVEDQVVLSQRVEAIAKFCDEQFKDSLELTTNALFHLAVINFHQLQADLRSVLQAAAGIYQMMEQHDKGVGNEAPSGDENPPSDQDAQS